MSLHGRGFAHRHVEDNVALSYPPAIAGDFNIGLLHTSLTGRDGHDNYAPCSVEDLQRTGYDYWALGHVHRREIVAENPAIVFPGNLQGRHARETGEKGATLVRVADGRIDRMEALCLDAARFDHATIELSGVCDQSAMMRKAHEAITAAHRAAGGRPLALRITFSGATPLRTRLAAHPLQIEEDLQAVAAEIGDDILVEKVRNETSAPHTAPRLTLAGLDDILASVAADPAFRAEVAATLGNLRTKAPVEALRLLEADGDDAHDAAIREATQAILAALDDAPGAAS